MTIHEDLGVVEGVLLGLKAFSIAGKLTHNSIDEALERLGNARKHLREVQVIGSVDSETGTVSIDEGHDIGEL